MHEDTYPTHQKIQAFDISAALLVDGVISAIKVEVRGMLIPMAKL